MRVLVAICDDERSTKQNGRALAAVTFEGPVPVTRNFDPRLPPIGRATLTQEGTQLFAELELAVPATEVDGLFPAIGGVAAELSDSVILNLQVKEVSLCVGPNDDARVPAIRLTLREQQLIAALRHARGCKQCSDFLDCPDSAQHAAAYAMAFGEPA